VALLTRHLSRAGYELVSERVETAAAMKAALESREWDVILCDYSMPHFSGLSALAVLKETGLNIPFIIISGTVGEEQAVEAMRAGAHDYLMKDNLVRLAPIIERELHEAENRRARRVAEESFKASEAELRALFAAITDVIFVFDSEGRYLRIAPTGPTDLYAPPAGRVGKTLHEVFPKDEADFLLGHIRRALDEGQMQRVEYSLPIEGAEIWFDGSVSPLSPNSVVWVARDITERKRAEDELRRQKEILQKIFDHIPLIIGFADESGRVKLVNLEWERTLGWSLEEIEKQKLDIFAELYPDAQERQKALDFIAESTGEWRDFKTKARHGRVIDMTWANVHLSEGTTIGIGQDITWRKRAEQENQKLLHDLAERIKELTALHGAARILQREWTDTATVLRELAALLPSAVQYPEVAAARICIGQIEAATPRVATSRFAPSPSTLRADFTTADNQPGSIEVIYTADRPPAAIGPFLIEEHDLINTLGDMLLTAYDRRQTETALRESERRFRQLAENIREVFWMRTPEISEILYVSPTYESIWGQPRESLSSDPRSFLDAIHPEDRERAVSVMEHEQERGFELEYRIVKPDGQVRWVWDRGFPVRDESGRVYRIAGIAEDITERKQAEQELRKSEERYRDLVENARDVIYTTDLEGTYTSVNKAGEQLLGYTREEALKLSPADVIAPEYLAKARQMLARKLAGESETVYELEAVRKDGRRVTIELNTRLVYRDNVPVGVQGIGRDVTERKRAEERLRKSNEKLRALAARLQAVREEESIKIAREIHDELGGGLTGLKMDVSWIERRMPGVGDEAIRQKLRSMSELIDETIQKVRNISTELRPSVLDDLGLAAAIEWQAREFQRRTEIECVITSLDEEVALSAEKSTAVFRIFQEVLTNVARHARATRVEISMEKRDGDLVLKVCDDGRGIRESDISDTRSLGLLGMRERAVVFGGVVEIEGARGRGTTVTVRIPLE
jgi:PAS domain S-box-containing protein